MINDNRLVEWDMHMKNYKILRGNIINDYENKITKCELENKTIIQKCCTISGPKYEKAICYFFNQMRTFELN